MITERWARLKEVFEAASSRDAKSREEFLDGACAGDAEFRREVETLLEAHEDAGSFLDPEGSSAPPPIRVMPDASLVGSQIGPYLVRSLLGAGGMGEVYSAFDPRLNREVAIKILMATNADDPAWTARFEREARAVGTLSHPNIVAVHDLGSHEGVLYLVEELLIGETLRDRIATGQVTLAEALDWAQQIATGLAAAHEREIIHRDLKPENVFVTRDGRVKILDFGIAKVTSRRERGPVQGSTLSARRTGEEGLTGAGGIVGTVGYMSPEQILGQPVDARSDIFSFGAVFYELVAGRRAFPGGSRLQILFSTLKDEPEPLSVPLGLAAPPLQEVVRRCLAKPPEDRYQSVADLRVALASLARPAAEMVGGGERRRFTKRSLRLVVAGSVLVAALAATAAGLLLVPGPGSIERRDGVGAGARAVAEPPLTPRFTRVTFTRDAYTAEFGADEQTFIFVRVAKGIPSLHRARIGAEESQPLGLENTFICDVSAKDELLIGRRSAATPWMSATGATLARFPLTGGGPQDLATSVTWASWSTDGSSIAAIRRTSEQFVVEYPLGTILYESTSPIDMPVVSPRGDQIAFSEWLVEGETRGAVSLLDRNGVKRRLTRTFPSLCCPAWAPDGKAVYFSASEGQEKYEIWKVSLDGEERAIAQTPDALFVSDVAADGRLLAHRRVLNFRIRARRPGEPRDRDLSGYSAAFATDISGDGGQILLVDTGALPGPEYKIYLRRTDGSPPTLVGQGSLGSRLSPDGRHVLTGSVVDPAVIRILPTSGAGAIRELPRHDLKERAWPMWTPDGLGAIFVGRDPSGVRRLYVQGLDGGPPRAFGPVGAAMPRYPGKVVSPDGRWVAALDKDGGWSLAEIRGSRVRSLSQVKNEESVLQWTEDGRFLYIASAETGIPIGIDKLDLATGRRFHFATIGEGAANANAAPFVFLNRGGTAWVYSSFEENSDIYIVDFPSPRP